MVRTSEKSPYTTIRDTITKAPGGVKKATIIPHGPGTITRMANVYGTIEYGVLREEGARTLYKLADFDVRLHPEVDYEYSAWRWLDMAEKYIFPKKRLFGTVAEVYVLRHAFGNSQPVAGRHHGL